MDKATVEIAKRFASKAKKAFSAEKVILFGSRSRGDNFKNSDFDFLIVSRKFAGIPFIERLSKVYDYWSEKFDIEAICYTPEEFERKSKEHGTVRNALREGIEL